MFAARVIFLVAGIYGLVVLLPMYAAESTFSAEYPPAITHTEFYYGFLGVTIAWQVAYVIMSWDIKRYRLMIIPAIIEKVGFVIPALILTVVGRLPWPLVGAAAIDFLFAGLFVFAWYKTSPAKTTT